MNRSNFYWIILTKRRDKAETKALREIIRKQHFLPRDRFKIVMDNGLYRCVCRIFEKEIPRFGFRGLRERLRMLRHHTVKVEKWRKKSGGCVR